MDKEMTDTWHSVCQLTDVGPGEMIAKEIAGFQIAIYNVDGEVFATDNICTHAYALLTDGWLDNDVIECPLHGGQFSVRTGEALCEPAECDLRTHAVRIVDNQIQVLLSS